MKKNNSNQLDKNSERKIEEVEFSMKMFYGKRNSIQVDPIELSKVMPKIQGDRGKTIDIKLNSINSELPDCLHYNKLTENNKNLKAAKHTNTVKNSTPDKKIQKFQLKLNSRQFESEEKRKLNASLQSRNAFGFFKTSLQSQSPSQTANLILPIKTNYKYKPGQNLNRRKLTKWQICESMFSGVGVGVNAENSIRTSKRVFSEEPK